MTTATLAPTTGARPLADMLTMLRRNLLRAVRYPGLTSFTVMIPVLLLLLFVFVLGGAIGAGVSPGVAAGAAGRAVYLDYITPAILLFAVLGAAQSVAITAAPPNSARLLTQSVGHASKSERGARPRMGGPTRTRIARIRPATAPAASTTPSVRHACRARLERPTW